MPMGCAMNDPRPDEGPFLAAGLSRDPATELSRESVYLGAGKSSRVRGIADLEDPMVQAVRDRALEPEVTWPSAGPNPSPAVSDLGVHGPRWMMQPPSALGARHAACPPPSYQPTLCWMLFR